MAVSDFAKNHTHGTIRFYDATPVTPLELVLVYDMGDQSLTGVKEKLNELAKVERRGRHVSAGYGVRVYPQWAVTAIMTQFTDAAAGTLADWMLRTTGSAYAAAISTLGAGRPWAFNVEVTIEGTDFGDDADHQFVLEDFHPSADFAEGAPSNTWALSGEVLGAITGDTPASEIT